MLKQHKTILLAGYLISALALSSPACADNATQLYQKHCTSCHGSEMYTRADRRVKSLQELKKQVRQCSYTLETRWFDNEINSVSDYLNRNFYRF